MSRIFSIVILAALAGTASASPRLAGYVGIHPLADDVLCLIEGPHLHASAPEHRELYIVVDGRFHFTGDPTSFKYEGPTYVFHGHHPIVVLDRVHDKTCNLDGPHHHLYKPPVSASFVLRGEAYVFVDAKPRRRPATHVVHHQPPVVVDVHYDVVYRKRHKKHRKHKHHHHHHHHHDDDD